MIVVRRQCDAADGAKGLLSSAREGAGVSGKRHDPEKKGKSQAQRRQQQIKRSRKQTAAQGP